MDKTLFMCEQQDDLINTLKERITVLEQLIKGVEFEEFRIYCHSINGVAWSDVRDEALLNK